MRRRRAASPTTAHRRTSSLAPPVLNDAAVVLLGKRCPERNQGDPVRAALEVAHHSRPDPEDVPLPQVVDLVVELDATGALGDHVDLLLPRVGVTERSAHAGRQLLDSDPADRAAELTLREPRVQALRPLELRRDVLAVAEINDRVHAHDRDATSYGGPSRDAAAPPASTSPAPARAH